MESRVSLKDQWVQSEILRLGMRSTLLTCMCLLWISDARMNNGCPHISDVHAAPSAASDVREERFARARLPCNACNNESAVLACLELANANLGRYSPRVLTSLHPFMLIELPAWVSALSHSLGAADASLGRPTLT